MASTGTIDIVFDATPADEASVNVTGQAAILATSQAEAWVMGATSVDNNENAHLFGGVALRITCGIPVDGVGFTIYATSIAGLATGTFKIQWVWN